MKFFSRVSNLTNYLDLKLLIKLFTCTFKGNEPAPNTVHQVAFVWDANSNDLANSQTVLSPVVSSNLVTTQCGLKKHEHFIHVFCRWQNHNGNLFRADIRRLVKGRLTMNTTYITTHIL